MTRQKKIIAVDMDDTILYLMKAILADHKSKYPDHPLTYEDMVAFNESMFHPDYNKFDFFHAPGSFFNLEIMQDVQEELAIMHEEHDVLIVTSAYPETVLEKWQWLQKYLPFIPHSNFCSMSRKDLIQADLLIDDAIHNVTKWVAKGRPALVPLHHWNQDLERLEGVTMFDKWKGLSQTVNTILGTVPVN